MKCILQQSALQYCLLYLEAAAYFIACFIFVRIFFPFVSYETGKKNRSEPRSVFPFLCLFDSNYVVGKCLHGIFYTMFQYADENIFFFFFCPERMKSNNKYDRMKKEKKLIGCNGNDCVRERRHLCSKR